MQLPRLVDAALDRLVVPGYSRLGFAARRAGWDTLRAGSLAGRTILKGRDQLRRQRNLAIAVRFHPRSLTIEGAIVE